MVGLQLIHRTRDWRRTPANVALLCASLLLLALPHATRAQEEPAPGVPLLSESGGAGVRPELQALLQDVEAQLRVATNAGNQEDIDRLIDLRGQLQVIELQVELEELQNENADLIAQDANAGTTTDAESPEVSEMQDEVESLNDMQSETVQELNDIAEQHAALLEQRGQAAPGTNAEPLRSATSAARITEELRQVRALSARFQKLAEQQEQIGEVLAVVSTEHANLLTALGVPEPAHAKSSYTVRAGDSLSRIAGEAYGDQNRWPEISAANPSLADPSVLYVGMILTLP